eukprot:1159105-Pelagomonas_calceolata.AAC.2
MGKVRLVHIEVHPGLHSKHSRTTKPALAYACMCQGCCFWCNANSVMTDQLVHPCPALFISCAVQPCQHSSNPPQATAAKQASGSSCPHQIRLSACSPSMQPKQISAHSPLHPTFWYDILLSA